MAWNQVSYKLISSCPMIPHNGQTADPLNKWAKALKLISSKRQKTEADYLEMAHLEFLAALYMAEDGPVIPTHVMDAVIVNGAKKSKEGMTAKSGCFCFEHSRIEYDGPRTAEELWNDERFRFSAIVKVGMARVVRMRPIFNDWSAVVTLHVEDGLVNIARVDEWLNASGTQAGIGDWRPQYGRFTAQRLNGK